MTAVFRSQRRIARVVSCAGTVLSSAMLLVTLFGTPHQTANAAAANGGPVQILNPADDQPLAAGGSATEIKLAPPPGAACPGGATGTPSYRWQMYMVDAGVDVSTLTYLSGPQQVDGHTVLKVYDASSGSAVKDKNPSANPLGQITGIPSISFAALSPGDVPPGDYKIGFACTQAGTTVTYWTAGMTVTTDTSDLPAGFTWVPKTLPVNQPPVAVNDTANAQAGAGPVTVDVRANDSDPDADPLSVTAVTQGSKGSVVFTATGVTYTANAGSSGSDTFTYTISDGTLTATATVAVTIAAAADTTTSTLVSTSTTVAQTSTTVPGSTTTVVGSTTTTHLATSVSGTPTTARTSSNTAAPLADTGTSPVPIVIWAILLLVFGRMAVLLSRPVRVRPPQQ